MVFRIDKMICIFLICPLIPLLIVMDNCNGLFMKDWNTSSSEVVCSDCGVIELHSTFCLNVREANLTKKIHIAMCNWNLAPTYFTVAYGCFISFTTPLQNLDFISTPLTEPSCSESQFLPAVSRASREGR